jgi:hypothetical protein
MRDTDGYLIRIAGPVAILRLTGVRVAHNVLQLDDLPIVGAESYTIRLDDLLRTGLGLI